MLCSTKSKKMISIDSSINKKTNFHAKGYINKDAPNCQELLTTEQALAYYGISRPTLWRWANSGILKAYKDDKQHTYYERLQIGYLTKQEVMYQLGMSKSTFHRRIKAGYFHPINIGGRTFFSPSEVEAYQSRQLYPTPMTLRQQEVRK